ncbi:MAG: ABC transporter permease [Oscillospiraceae bacterium]|jgi:putative ABC transport system permease protein|nr:ABC transporter permease [Oscillospiraceae bacterium]
MKLTAKLALAQLRKGGRRTLLTLLGIALSVGMITAIFGFAQSGIDSLRNTVASRGDYHVAYLWLSAGEAEAITTDQAFESSYTQPDEMGSVGLYARLKQPSGSSEKLYTQMAEIAARHGVIASRYDPELNQDLLSLEGYIPSGYTSSIYTIAAVLLVVVVLASVIVVSSAFRLSAGERIRQFGMLKSVGATKRQIRASVLDEGLFLTCIGIPLGVGLGLLVDVLMIPVINGMLNDLNSINSNALIFQFIVSWEGIALSALLSLVTVFISCWLPARKAAKIPAIEAIRASGEVKLTARKVRVSRLTRRLFGFEGELAARHMKRSRRSYRATVAALAASVVLSVVGASFGQMTLQANEAMFAGMDMDAVALYETGDVYITLPSGTDLAEVQNLPPALERAMADAVAAKLREYPGAEVAWVGADTVLEVNEQGERINPIAVDDATYKTLLQASGAKQGEAIWLGDAPRPAITAWGRLWMIGGALAEAPEALTAAMLPDALNLVLPIGAGRSVMWLVQVEDSAGFTDYAQQVLLDMIPHPEGSGIRLSAQDVRHMQSGTMELSRLVMILVYGFIGMLTLIGLTNVVSTIATQIRLRRGEFAVLLSVGMTREGLMRSLRFESLLCALRALLFGVPIALGLSYWMYTSMAELMTIDYQVPWLPIGVAVVAVLIVMLITMRFSTTTFKGKPLMEAIRAD